MEPSAEQVVRLGVDAGIATITLDSQPNCNALSRQLVAELGERLDEIESTAGVRVIVLTNAGPAFCAGADLKERSTGTPDSTPMVRVLERLMDAAQVRDRFSGGTPLDDDGPFLPPPPRPRFR